MKILSWNINGIRASKIDLKTLFDSLDADVICLQETKVTRDQLDEPTAIVDGYSSYFSFSRKRSGYSGVANFCRDSATPCSAEEGLTSLLNQKDDGKVGCYGDTTHFSTDELEALDAEGRTVITQHRIQLSDGSEGRLAIINVYCPRVDPERDDRKVYKMRFLALLQTRAEALLQSGSHVIVLGDLNLNHKRIDNCDPVLEDWGKAPSRMWMNQFVWEPGRDPDIESIGNTEEFLGTTSSVKGGLFVDTFRHLYPTKTEAYSNWCTLTSARETNYGRRLDYILCDVSMTKRDLKESLVMRDVEGSDHCPVKTEFTSSFLPAGKCPALCTKCMPEFVGKQQKLSSFFVKASKSNDSSSKQGNKGSPKKTLSITCVSEQRSKHVSNSQVKSPNKSEGGLKRSNSDRSERSGPLAKKKKGDIKNGSSLPKQSNLMNFFGKPASKKDTTPDTSVTSRADCEVVKICQNDQENGNEKNKSVSTRNDSKVDLISSEDNESPSSSQELKGGGEIKVKKTSALAWKSLLKGPPTAPLCKGHKEPCLLRTVKKEGPNRGKQFFVCCRAEGLNSNPEARCDFFKWVDSKK
ncbi:DNA-(apurinic or apyrimidinic site) lyase 2-like [Mizuhopecten yessoensis]|uniref:DNA-(apurinic or apyrimidinic site) endonuclease n=1 Tax=Mizuhopecten yessoensis TaxID=6573 RepID=A0A210Q174_MIZYE|nr:DNA-(apurinic or apyrimidinic site) lyase 2-like [Mizuhopecten yessoensis]OWF42500.1 DNA-(apurinic or apyrimidinic site) lyase 2 [Mizuhopecten yessoensis]